MALGADGNWSASMEGYVSRVDKTRAEGWIRSREHGKKEWFFLGHDLQGGLCISKIKKGDGVFFIPQDKPTPRAKKVRPISVLVVDNWGDED